MKKNAFRTFTNTIKYWYIPAIVGLIFIAVGIYTFTAPLNSYIALALLFSISFIITGLSEIIFSISNTDKMDNWAWILTFGVITLIVGILLLINPALSMLSLAFYIGFLLLFRSISAISVSLNLKEYGFNDWGLLMLLGVLGVVFSFLMIWKPSFAGLTIIIWTGLALITGGFFSIYLAVKLKKLNDLPNNMPNELKEKLAEMQQEVDDFYRVTNRKS